MLINELPDYRLKDGKSAVSIARLVEVVRQASEAILRVYACENIEEWAIESKSDKSPLTRADKEAHDIIVKNLQGPDFPAIGIISEEDESTRVAFADRVDWDYVWLVDPLDGTKEFIKRNGEFTVNIGLAYKGEAVGGIVSIPVNNLCYIGFEGLGVWRFHFDKMELEKIECRKFNWSDPRLIVISSRSHGNKLIENLLKTLGPNYEMSVKGSSIKMLAVAEGSAHIYPRFGPCCEWDTCAAHGIVKEAGGEIYQVEDSLTVSKESLKYNKENLLNPFFLCVGNIDPKFLEGLKFQTESSGEDSDQVGREGI